MDKPFHNQTVIISGGLGDIGLAVAYKFAALGASIAIGDIHADDVAYKMLQDFIDQKFEFHYQQVNVSDGNAVAAWIDQIEQNLKIPSIIIANAAIVTKVGVLDARPKQWEDEIGVNLNGAFFIAQCAARRLVENKMPGRIVFVGSWAAHAVHPNLAAYCVSKAGIRMLCKCMALELAPHHILVNEIAPGYVDAGLSGRAWKFHPDVKKEAIERVPVKKLITAEDVAVQIVHLCHPHNEHMTGSTLLMDGGLSL